MEKNAETSPAMVPVNSVKFASAVVRMSLPVLSVRKDIPATNGRIAISTKIIPSFLPSFTAIPLVIGRDQFSSERTTIRSKGSNRSLLALGGLITGMRSRFFM